MSNEVFVNKKQIAERLKIGSRKVSDLVTEEYWPDPIELSPRVLRWKWSEIEQALAERAPRRTERHEPEALRAARRQGQEGERSRERSS